MNLTDGALATTELHTALESGNPERIARTAAANVWPLYCAHYEELTRVIEALPAPILARYPTLRVLHRMTPVLARTTRPYKPLIDPDGARSMSADELDLLTLAQMVAFRFSGDVAAASIYGRRLSDRIVQIHIDARERTDGPLWFYHHQIGSTLLAAGESSSALFELSVSRQLGRLSRQPDAERLALGRIALAHAVRGSMEDAELALAEAVSHHPPTAAHRTSTRMTERATAALIGVERMLPEVEDLLAGLEPYDSIELTWPFALLARTRALMALQRPDEALEAVRLASDAHPDQHGSIASDVIASASMDALWAIGATSAAARIADSASRAGRLSRFAITRLALLECRWDVADQGLRRIAAEQSLDPGARALLILMSAWLQYGMTDTVDAPTARQVSRLVKNTGTRRILATMPIQLTEHVRGSLPNAEGVAFDRAVRGLPHIDAPRRPTLTPGELRVLNTLPSHTTTAQIATTIHVSPNTVKSQLKALYRKLGCSTRDDAIIIATRFRLLSDGEG